MRTIPLQAVPSQSLSVLLAQQNCQLNVYQKSTGLFLDLFINDSTVVTAVICRDRVRMVRQEYHGFVGDLCFADSLGNNDPDYAGLGGRYALVYLEPADLL
jgi:hypothetical protein